MSYLAKSMIFHFDDLPLVTSASGGIEAGFVNGEAELEYECDGEWMIINITLEGASTTGPDNKRFWPQVDAPPVIAAIIDQRLNKEWSDRVQDAVREQLASDHEDAMEARADARRDDRMMGY
jgi:hypothetical protein